MGIMVSSQYKPDRVMSTDSRTRYAAGFMLAAEDAGVVFAIDYGKVCEREDVPVVGAAPATLEPEIRKYRDELASLTMLSETESMVSIGRMLTGRPR